MLEMILDKKLLFVLMGILTGIGVADKCIVSVTMKRMVEAAGNMSKSNHPLMRLIRAKFEHACMISDTVENVGVFVDKYLFEYRICGLRLHSMQRMEKICAGLLAVTGLAGAGITYQVYGMSDAVLRIGACGIGLGILVWLFHLTTDEAYCMQMAKNYMVDYLENVCLHKYEKVNQKDRIRTMQQENVSESDKKAEGKVKARELDTEMKNSDQESAEQERSVPSRAKEEHSAVQLQRENRRRERAKGTAKNLAKASARLAGTDTEESRNEGNPASAETIQKEIPKETIHTEPMQNNTSENSGEEASKEPSVELPKDEMIRQILREFMA